MEDKERKKEQEQEYTGQIATDVLKKYDKESDVMEYSGYFAKVISVIAIMFSLFQGSL
jgi:TRAP-type uncharacterized transport system fused permease subunit